MTMPATTTTIEDPRSEIAEVLATGYVRLTLSRRDSLAESGQAEAPCLHAVNTPENPERKERP